MIAEKKEKRRYKSKERDRKIGARIEEEEKYKSQQLVWRESDGKELD